MPGIGELIDILQPGKELEKQREALGLTQQQVAEQAKINVRQYQRIESGERNLRSATFQTGLSICHVLKIDPMFYCSVYHADNRKKDLETMSDDENVPDEVAAPVSRYKYILYTETDDCEPGEVISVEHGSNMDSVYDQIARAIRDELSERPQFAGCDIDIYPWEKMDDHKYSIQAVVLPPYASSNILVDFLVIEREQA